MTNRVAVKTGLDTTATAIISFGMAQIVNGDRLVGLILIFAGLGTVLFRHIWNESSRKEKTPWDDAP